MTSFKLDLSLMARRAPEPWQGHPGQDPDLPEDPWDGALASMAALEAGAIANPDEGRMVGHFWLRAPERAPAELQAPIREAQARVEALSAELRPRFPELLVVGIGGSALGPQFVADALDAPAFHCLDNTDPDGIARTLRRVDPARTLVVVISKSGGTVETRNGMLEVEAWLRAQGRRLQDQAVAITQEGSALHRASAGWLGQLPMWDWVGGRFSLSSAVGLFPMAMQGLDWRAFLAGAAWMDRQDHSLRLAQAWWSARPRSMVVLPYKDRLVLMSRYLQQLVMESLGKSTDLAGRPIHSGLTVYGNKGSTDQHAYVQQLRDGPNDFFATFVAVLEDGGAGIEVEPGVTSGDCLLGFLLGTRRALAESGRLSLTIEIPRVDAFHVGALVALYERAVGLYAAKLGINAYHQPGVEAGKKAAAEVLRLQAALLRGEAVDHPDAALVRAHLKANGRLPELP